MESKSGCAETVGKEFVAADGTYSIEEEIIESLFDGRQNNVNAVLRCS